MSDGWKNTLYYGDNLDVLRRHVEKETVDLIYLDPPFNSNASCSALFSAGNGSQAAARFKALDNDLVWERPWSDEARQRRAVWHQGSSCRRSR